jgi:hypothetical protein
MESDIKSDIMKTEPMVQNIKKKVEFGLLQIPENSEQSSNHDIV